MKQYEIDAGDIVSEALLDVNEAGQLDAIVKLVAGLLAKRDEDVRFLVNELQQVKPTNALADLVPFNPITGTTCLAGCEGKTQEQYYKASQVLELVAKLTAPLTDAEQAREQELRGLQAKAALGQFRPNCNGYAAHMGELIQIINKMRQPLLPQTVKGEQPNG